MTLARLPLIDLRGPQERGALARAYLERAWREQHEKRGIPRPFSWHTLRFVRAGKCAT